jgi:hypothetical protein
MEIEAWFLAEFSHFPRLDSDLTLETIRSNFGFDPSVDDMQLRNHPSQDIHRIYSLVGLEYKKYSSPHYLDSGEPFSSYVGVSVCHWAA